MNVKRFWKVLNKGEIDLRKEKIEKQLNKADTDILSDMEKAFAEEIDKPTDERDEDMISELGELISHMQDEISSVNIKIPSDEIPKNRKLYKIITVVVICVLVILGLNTVSLNVFGQNMFSATYQIANGSIKISPNQSDLTDTLETSPSDPYGMKAKCAEYGFFPKTPSYIPDGFILKKVDVLSDDYSDSIIFAYVKDNMILNFFYTNYKTNANIPPIGIPTDTYNFTEEQINGHTTYILKEDRQFTSVYVDRRIEHTIFVENLDYTECQKILESLS